MTQLRTLVFVLAVCCGMSAACDGDSTVTTCTADSQCDPTGQGFNSCDEAQGFCLCNDDRGCDPGEFCNSAGRCQAEAGCLTNEDCGTDGQGLFCDVTTAQCLSVAECNPQAGEICCTLDSQCPFRQICDGLSLTCTPGCRDNADCLLGEGCAGAGVGTVGQCGGTCTADNLCPYGHLCNLATGACERDTRGSYCAGCTVDEDCRDPGSYCLTDSITASEFCGVDCSSGEACPNGYRCADVVIVPPAAPFCSFPEVCTFAEGARDGVCSRTRGVCTTDEECPEGPPQGDCAVQTGRHGSCADNPNTPCQFDEDCPSGTCVRTECLGREGARFGRCSCTRDADCPTDECDGADLSDAANPIVGHCKLTGHDCFEDADCTIITCVDGGCLIGQNCVPSSGLTCRDVGFSGSGM